VDASQTASCKGVMSDACQSDVVKQNPAETMEFPDRKFMNNSLIYQHFQYYVFKFRADFTGLPLIPTVEICSRNF
jgi:hypothetical protein